jgi:hypothetical protein
MTTTVPFLARMARAELDEVRRELKKVCPLARPDAGRHRAYSYRLYSIPALLC